MELAGGRSTEVPRDLGNEGFDEEFVTRDGTFCYYWWARYAV